jgi:predicted O-linked N-acetylglucosamine transferase (SPINDLY family)
VCLSAWGRVLRQVAGSTLVIKSPALADESVRALSVQRLAAAGVDPSRVRLMGGEKSTAEHLGRYREIDIALDTFPYAGTTTTCEALVMGVPVVCMCRAMGKGGSHAERVGASLLRCVGLEDLAAESVEGFVQNAAGLARDTRRLEELHRTLRGRLMGSALCDGPGHAQRFGDAVAQAWNAWAGS